MSEPFVRRFRERELDQVLPYFPQRPGARVLEVGAGAGWQSIALHRRGYDVAAFDIAPESWGELCWEVSLYDGHRFPVADESFDVVFSSNVLEHIPHVEELQREFMRVLKPGGRAIHILPSPMWRAWTTVAHYPAVAKKIFDRLLPVENGGVSPATGLSVLSGGDGVSGRVGLLRNNLLPVRHGEYGNSLTELAWFSRVRWERLFRRTGWKLDAYVRGDLFYTGVVLLGSKLGIQRRTRLARLLGAATHSFVLSKPAGGGQRG